jgi:hypothetical protein
VRDNDLESIPPQIGQLKNLKILLLQGNKLMFLPRQLANTRLAEDDRQLKLAGNPLVMPIIQCLRKGGVAALFEFMNDPKYDAAISG